VQCCNRGLPILWSFYFWTATITLGKFSPIPRAAIVGLFERGDQEGVGHMSRKFERPESTKRRTKPQG